MIRLREMFRKGNIYPSRLNFSEFPKPFPPAERGPLRSWDTANEPGLMGWSLSLRGVLKLPGSELFWGNTLCFPQKKPSSASELPSNKLYPRCYVFEAAPMGCGTGTRSPSHDPNPTKASCHKVVPQILVWHMQIQPFSQ